MKTILFSLTLTVLFSITAMAQVYEETEEVSSSKSDYPGEIKTLTRGRYHSGGFGALSFKSSEFRDQTLVMGGVRGGWIVNRSLAIGFEGYGVIPTIEMEDAAWSDDFRLVGGYGGLFLEPILFSNRVIHVTFPMAAGAGWLGYEEDWEDDHHHYDHYDDDLIDEDVFWYVEPGVAMEVNVSRHFRLNMGISKRFVNDYKLIWSNAGDLENLNYFLTLKFGRF